MGRRLLLLIPISFLTAVACYIENRSAPQAGVIGDTRTVISAESAYQEANSGYYGTITCLATPSACIPSYSGPSFLDSTLAAATVTKGEYTRKWFEIKSPPGAPPGSIDSFCYGATTEISHRVAVGGDSSGLVGYGKNGSAACCTAQGRLDLKNCPPLK
jgi:hypothetical protein